MSDPGLDMILTGAVLTLVCGLAIWFDIRENRIPNRLTLAALLTALLLRVPGGMPEITAGFLGGAIAFALAMIFFLMGGLGGGDVKFLAAVGAFLGPVDLWMALFVMAMVGGVMAVFVIVRNRAVQQTAANLHSILVTLGPSSLKGWQGPGAGSAVTLETPGILTVPYGVAIAAGALAAWFF